MFGLQSLYNGLCNRLFVNSNNIVSNQIRTLYKHKSKSACKKRFQLTKIGHVKFHPRSNPGKVYYVQGTAVNKTFKQVLFSQSYTKPAFISNSQCSFEVTDVVQH
ncbi:hypothetical protein SAMD00019534_095580, partial [Acytostelium subglobosum LB1]|uniref:hypothetical protein n=1 Tax=Acytostelium subglobosum LB1 TaxID=1410327 RepID=UPI000644A1C9